MFRFLLRVLGYVAIAAGFVGLMIDGARSIANSVVLLTPLGELIQRLAGDGLARLQPLIERNIHPLLWDPVMTNVLRLPAAGVGLALGFLLLWLGQPRAEPVGHVTRR